MHTETGYGVDVAVGRVDDMDRKMLAYLTDRMNDGMKVLDIGCGAGGQSLRMALAGARVVALDIHNFSPSFTATSATYSLSKSQLNFIQGDMTDLEHLLAGEQYDLCSLQRVLHYVPYEVAVIIIMTLRRQVRGPLYLTVTGVTSDIGKYCPSVNKKLEERFCVLNPVGAGLFRITKPMCLYSQIELEILLQNCGWKLLESRVSAFGNIKIVCI